METIGKSKTLNQDSLHGGTHCATSRSRTTGVRFLLADSAVSLRVKSVEGLGFGV